MPSTFCSALICSPDYFNVEYVINPWMEGQESVDCQHALSQWPALKQAIEQFLEKPAQTISSQKALPDIVFATDGGIVLDEATILWYPPGFPPATQKRLQNLGVELIEVHANDARKFTLNSLVGEKRIVVGKGINDTFDLLERRGWQVRQVDVSEFIKSGGGLHCLVCQ